MIKKNLIRTNTTSNKKQKKKQLIEQINISKFVGTQYSMTPTAIS